MKTALKITLAATLLFSSGCSDMFSTIQDHLDQGETNYASKIDSLKVLAGENRVLVKGLLMYGFDTKQCRIKWQPGNGEKLIAVERIKTIDVFEQYIDNLAEGTYEFQVITLDGDGNSSIVQNFTAKSYGQIYKNSLRARVVTKAIQDDEQLQISLSPVLQESLNSVLVYQDKTGKNMRLNIPTTASSVSLDSWKSEGVFTLETHYKPELTAADTFIVSSAESYFPKYERIKMVPKQGFAVVNLVGDLALNAWGSSMTNLWDGVVHNDNFAHSWGGWGDGSACFTFDMGKTAQLHSFRLNGIARTPDRLFDEGYMKQWEIWGTDLPPATDGSWQGWEKLLDCSSVKPSGLPLTQYSDGDLARGAEGETFLFTGQEPHVRYIRIKVNQVWNATIGNGKFLALTELTFWENLPQ